MLNKRLWAHILITCMLVFVMSGPALAAEEEADPGLTPDSSFYFFKILGEKIEYVLTFGDDNKAKVLAKHAEERLLEAKAMAAAGEEELAAEMAEKFTALMEKAQGKIDEAAADGEEEANLEEAVKAIEKAAVKATEVLTEVLAKVPDQAKPAIEKAMEAGNKGMAKSVEVLGGIGRGREKGDNEEVTGEAVEGDEQEAAGEESAKDTARNEIGKAGVNENANEQGITNGTAGMEQAKEKRTQAPIAEKKKETAKPEKGNEEKANVKNEPKPDVKEKQEFVDQREKTTGNDAPVKNEQPEAGAPVKNEQPEAGTPGGADRGR